MKYNRLQCKQNTGIQLIFQIQLYAFRTKNYFFSKNYFKYKKLSKLKVKG